MIFPDWGEATRGNAEETLPLYTEWALDWKAGGFSLREGAPYLVSGNEALKIWVRRALHPQARRFVCSAHSHDYGNELGELLGEPLDGITESRVERCVREAVVVCPYIRGVEGFSFHRAGSTLTVTFTVRTVYGVFQEEREVLL